MQIDGKIYRYISTAYFALHCFHLAAMVAGSFLPFIDDQNLYHMFNAYWPLLVLGFVGLAAGCYCAWRTLNRPYFSLAALLLSLAWHLPYYLIVVFYASATVIGSAISGQLVSEVFGVGFNILSYGLLLFPIDIAFVAYIVILMFFEPKSIKC